MANISTIPAGLINEVMNAGLSHIEKANSNPEVGMCGTYYIGSDSYAYVVVDVLGKTRIEATSFTNVFSENPDDFKMCTKVKPGKRTVNRNGKKVDVYVIDIINYAETDENGIQRVPVEYVNMWKAYQERVIADKKKKYKGFIFDDDMKVSETYSLRKNGRWVRCGQNAYNSGGLHLGQAHEYRDPSF